MLHWKVICITFIAISLMFVCISYAKIDPKTCVGMWYFDEGTGEVASDSSGRAHLGKLMKGPKWVSGKFGKALSFDGKDDYVGIPALEIRTDSKSFTAIGWFKTDESKNGPLWMWGDNPTPSSSSDAEAPVGWRSNGNFAAGFYIGGHKYAEAEQSYTDGKWHFVAQVGDEDTGYLYVDGEQISSANAGYVYASNPYFILSARSKNSGSEIDDVEYFNGIIDEVALFNVALTEEDIQEIAAKKSAVSPKAKLTTTWGDIKQ